MPKKTPPRSQAYAVKKRLDHEPPAAISEQGWQYHHLGIPTRHPRPGEKYLKNLKIFVSGFETSPYGVEWMRFTPDCHLPEMVKTKPHIAFAVDNLDQTLQGKKILIKPGSPSRNVRAAMIIHNGALIELIEFSRGQKAGPGGFYVYMLQCADQSYYTGYTRDIKKRLETHARGQGSAYVFSRKPFRLIYQEKYPDQRAAMRREIQIKKMSRAKKEALLMVGLHYRRKNAR